MLFEGQLWDGATPKAWGVNSIPQTFIISPDGDVLWRGHPAEIDAPLEAAFKNHPPQLVDPKVLQQAKDSLDQVDKALADQQPAKALKLLAGVPDAAKLDGDVAARSAADSDQLQQFGNSELSRIDPLIQSQQYAVAIQKLRELSSAFAGTPVAASAKTKLSELGSNPKVKAALDAERFEKEAADALAIANQLKTAKKDDLAYAQFKTVVKGYPNTAAAAEAAVVVKAYESNTAFMTAYNNKANTKKAESLLLMADNYRLMGNADKAREKYQQVLADFPNTTWADSAKKGIAAIGDGQ